MQFTREGLSRSSLKKIVFQIFFKSGSRKPGAIPTFSVGSRTPK